MSRELLSAAETHEPTRGSLDHVLENDAEMRLLAALDRTADLVREARAEDAATPVDPSVLDRLARAARADDAPFEAQWLRRRVAAGDLGWDEVWRAPETFSGGLWVWRQVQEGRA